MMCKNNIRNFLKKIYILVFTMILIVTFVSPVYAKEIPSNNKVPSDVSEEVIRCLNAIEDEKEFFGLKNVNFENISMGNQILAYEYKDGNLNLLNVSIYPLTINENLVALVVRSNNTGNYQITTGLVKEISSSINSNEPFALVYDNNKCYAYTGKDLIMLNQFSDEYGNGRQKIDKVEDIANISETKFNKYSSAQSLRYSENIKASTAATSINSTTANNYVSCEVPYIPQGSNEICWAASVACIGNYLRGQNHSAVYVAQCLYGNDYNHGISDNSIAITVLNSIYNNVSYEYHAWVVPNEYFIWNNIFSGKPLYGGWECGSAKHVAVICAISTTNDYICVEDPASGRIMSGYSGSEYTFFSPGNGLTWDLIGYGASIY